MLPYSLRRRWRPSRLVLLIGTLVVLLLLFVLPSSQPATVNRIFKPIREREWAIPSYVGQGLHSGSGAAPMLRDVRKPPGTMVSAPQRANDVLDSFAAYRRTPECYINSLDLHEPFEPLCTDRASVLLAMSDGGRAGMNAPYRPRGCDMRWYTTEEICDIMSRFSYVWFIGDSLMRHVTSAIHLQMRQDLLEGGYTKWRPNKLEDCTCNGASENGGCFGNEAWSSREIWEEDPASMRCPRNSTARVEYTVHNKFPLSEEDLHGFRLIMPKEEPEKPMAFIFGHGLWNDLNVTHTAAWFEQVDELIQTEMPWLGHPDTSYYPKLFMTPNAGGVNKPVYFQDSQGNYAVMKFEWAARDMALEYGMEVVGTVNLTVQSSSPDGTHAGRRADLVKSQMALNWLDRLGEIS